MNGNKKRLYFNVAIVFFFISSSVAWLLPIALSEGYFIGIVFWVSLAAGIILMLLIERSRRKVKAKNSLPLIRFFRNKIAAVFDILLIISFIGVLIIFFVSGINEWLTSGIIFSFLFSLKMHFVFNSENYIYVYKK